MPVPSAPRRSRTRLPLLLTTAAATLATLHQIHLARHIVRLATPPAHPHTVGDGQARHDIGWFGDSVAAGTGLPALDVALPGIVAAELAGFGLATRNLPAAVNGAISADLADQARPCDIAVVHIGANDVTRGTRPADVAADVEAFITAMGQHGADTIVVDVPPVWVAPLVPDLLRPIVARRTRRISAALQQAAAQAGGLHVTLRWPLPRSRWRAAGTDFVADRYHPTSRAVGDAVAPLVAAVAGLAARRSGHDSAGNGSAATGPADTHRAPPQSTQHSCPSTS